jgi:hypothetical protein
VEQVKADFPLLHVVAVPRGTKPLTFAAGRTVALAPLSPPDQPFNPDSQARWRAVPDPEITREVIEADLRRQFASGTLTQLSIERRTLEALKDHPLLQGGTNGWRHTQDSEVWLVSAEGDLPLTTGLFGPPEPGAAALSRMAQVIMLISIETDGPFARMGVPSRTIQPSPTASTRALVL